MPTNMQIHPLRALRHPFFAGAFLFVAILTGTGAFGSYRIVLPLRMTYWALITLVAAASLSAICRVVARVRGPEWAMHIAVAVIGAVPTTLAAAAGALLINLSPLSPSRVSSFYPAAFILNLLLIALLQLTAKREVILEVGPHVVPDDAVPARIASRLPPRLARSRLVLLEAQDHYLRVATRDGEALVHMRFADAVAALEGSDGTRVHRSWWVARSAIDAMKFTSGRGELTLIDGTVVPVSRRFRPQAKALAQRPKP
jgi:DNA-binding LytR/AlgR family response regulator